LGTHTPEKELRKKAIVRKGNGCYAEEPLDGTTFALQEPGSTGNISSQGTATQLQKSGTLRNKHLREHAFQRMLQGADIRENRQSGKYIR
jgi:hypothetical protein